MKSAVDSHVGAERGRELLRACAVQAAVVQAPLRPVECGDALLQPGQQRFLFGPEALDTAG
jgi:hypothetical protein